MRTRGNTGHKINQEKSISYLKKIFYYYILYIKYYINTLNLITKVNLLFFCKDIDFDDFYILCQIQYLSTYVFSDNCKVYYNKSFYDGQNLDIIQENVSFYNN